MGQNLDQRKVEHEQVTANIYKFFTVYIYCRNSYEKAMARL